MFKKLLDNKKFCCEKFAFRYNGEKTMGLNFRVVKYSEKFLKKEAEIYNKKIEDVFDKRSISELVMHIL